MNKAQILGYAASLPAATFDCPFDEDFETTVLRHSDTGRWFGIVLRVPASFYGTAEEALNVKCPPDLIPLLTEKYAGTVFPAYHMNKRHWITIRFSADDELTADLLRLSYDLTDKKRKKEKSYD